MEYRELLLEQLSIDPTNYRGYYGDIKELACSIRDHGLFQNLVVVPHPTEPDRFVVKAGNRRLLAINSLVESGERDPYEVIMCLIDDHGSWADVIENTHREDVSMWRVGFRFIELMEGGMTQLELAAKLNVSNGTVANYTAVARGLHPAVMSKLERMGHKSINKTQCIALCRCLDDALQPILSDQLALLERFLTANMSRRVTRKKRARNIDQTSKAMVYERLMRLEHGYEVVPHQHAPVVMAIVKYLKGDSRHPTFPKGES